MDAKTRFIRVKRIRQLYHSSVIPVLLSGIVSLFVVAALWSSTNHSLLLIWYGAIFIAAIFRLFLITSFKNLAPTGMQVLKWERPYAISLFINMGIWSIGLLAAIPSNNQVALFIASIFLVGLAAATTAWYNQLRYMQLGSLLLVLPPNIIVLLTHGSTEALWVGIAACFMLVAYLFSCQIFQKITNDNLSLTYDLEKSVKKAKAIAHTDVLTGLKNRRAFFEAAPKALEKCLKKQQPVALIALDIDHFKKVNDSHGHASGDIVLQKVASLLIEKLGLSDICGRVGGEEFAILLPNTTARKAMATAEKIRKAIANLQIEIAEQKTLSITASLGITDLGDTVDDMLDFADQAMYQAKKHGRNHSVKYVANKTSSTKKASTRQKHR